MINDSGRVIAVQINGVTKGKIPFIRNEYRPATVDRAREEIGLEREYQNVLIPEKIVNFIIEQSK